MSSYAPLVFKAAFTAAVAQLGVMRKAAYGYLAVAVAFLLLAIFVFLPWGAGLGALPREMAFTMGLHNSLYHLDQAKWIMTLDYIRR